MLGHEFAGVLDDGTPVAVDPGNQCGVCALCAGGLRHLCIDNPILGDRRSTAVSPNGCCVRPEALVPLPAGLPVEHACLVEPVAVSIHGTGGRRDRRRRASRGRRRREHRPHRGRGRRGVAVRGRASKPATTRSARRASGSARRGPAEGEYDVVFEAAGTQSAVDRALELVRPGGTVVFLSTLWDPVTIPGVAAMMKEITMKWAFTYAQHGGGRDLDTAAALLARRPEIADTLITHRLPLTDAPAAFRLAEQRAARRDQGGGGAVIDLGLTGKRALVTGAGIGIGRGIARWLAMRGLRRDDRRPRRRRARGRDGRDRARGRRASLPVDGRPARSGARAHDGRVGGGPSSVVSTSP